MSTVSDVQHITREIRASFLKACKNGVTSDLWFQTMWSQSVGKSLSAKTVVLAGIALVISEASPSLPGEELMRVSSGMRLALAELRAEEGAASYAS